MSHLPPIFKCETFMNYFVVYVCKTFRFYQALLCTILDTHQNQGIL